MTIFWESSAPGSEAARDKWLLKKKSIFRKTVMPQAAKLPRTSGFFKKNSFLQKVLPQATKLPRTSGFFKKISFLQKVLPLAVKLPGTSCFL